MSSNPLVVTLPHIFATADSYPTEQLATRFNAWRSIVKDLVIYFKEYASVQQEIVSQQQRLQQVVGTSHELSVGNSDVETNKIFLPTGNGSIQDIPVMLSKFHNMNITNTNKTLKELNGVIIPKLEELRRDLVVKIKEIKNLQTDFKNNLSHEVTATKQLLIKYEQIMDKATKDSITSSASSIKSSNHADNSSNSYSEDPYIMRLKLDKQLKRQLNEEHFLHQAYQNLQNAGSKLESIIVLEVQTYINNFLNLLTAENSSIPEYLVPTLRDGFLAKEANFEWDSYIDRNLPKQASSINSTLAGTFIDLLIPSRKVSDLKIHKSESVLNRSIKEGPLERKSKYLKSYSSGFYVLTCEYLHEFKTNDRKKDLTPVMSLSLDSCTVSKHSQDSSGEFKFVLKSTKSTGLIHRSHNWLFRCSTYKEMIDWYNEIKNLTNLPTAISRARYIAKRDGIKSPPKHSRNSSIYTRGTSFSKSPTRNIESDKSKRLSSTFSERKTSSPRLANMINSDGTIITPVHTHDSGKEYDGEDQHKESYLRNASIAPSASLSQSQSQHQHQNPQRVQHNQTQSQSQIQYMVPPVPYVLNQNQPQQFYDPVKQQYYQITPINTKNEPIQPQYFPNTPGAPLVAVAGSTPRPTSPTYVYPPSQGSYAGHPQLVVPANYQAQYLQNDPSTNSLTKSVEQAHNQQFGEYLSSPEVDQSGFSPANEDFENDQPFSLQSRTELATIEEKEKHEHDYPPNFGIGNITIRRD